MDKVTCAYCNKEFDEMNTTYLNDNYICETCLNEHFIYCSYCEDLVERDYAYYDNNECAYCEHCFNEHVTYCKHCDNYYPIEDCYITHDEYFICPICYEDYYFHCESCAYVFNFNDAVEHNGCYYCEDCARDFKCDHIYEYDYKPNPIFHHIENDEENLHVGIELEIQGDNKKDFQDNFYLNFSEDDFYLKEDGSLDENGVEIVSMPMTYQYIQFTDYWKKVFELMNEYNMNDTEGCGLHFHLDRNYLDNFINIATIDYIVNNYDKYFSEHCGRIFNEYSSYCKKVNKTINDWGIKTVHDSRYQAVNLTNSNTIELRFCKSTCNYETFIERVKLIFTIVEFAKHYSIRDLINFNESQFIFLFNNIMKNV